jgi:hypothetical protein
MAQQQPAHDLLKESAKWGMAGPKFVGRSISIKVQGFQTPRIEVEPVE